MNQDHKRWPVPALRPPKGGGHGKFIRARSGSPFKELEGMLRPALSSLAIALLSISASAQVKDTTVKHNYSEITYYTFQQPHNMYRFDSALANFHLFPAFKIQDPFAEPIGNTGLPWVSSRFTNPQSFGVHQGFRAHDAYLFEHDNVPFYKPPFPFTSLNYIQGLSGEQQFNALHSQNVKGIVNFGANYRLLSSNGAFDQQATRVSNLHGFARYSSKSRRYGALLSGLVNGIQNETNGGVSQGLRSNPDSLFQLFPRSIVATRNGSAEIDQRHKELALYQHLSFGNRFDVALSDTADTLFFYPVLRVFHRLKYGDLRYSYDDLLPDSNYYTNIYLSTDSTFDETRHIFFHNTVGVSSSGIKTVDTSGTKYTRLKGQAWVRYTVDELSQLGHVFTYNNVWSGGQLESVTETLPVHVGVSAEAGVSGSHQGDYRARLSVGSLGANRIEASGSLTNTSASFIQQYYLGNHHRWDTTLAKQGLAGLALSYARPDRNLWLSTSFQNVSDYIYFDSTGSPAQAASATQIITLEAKHTLRWKSLRLHNHILVQSVNANTTIDLPTWSSRHKLYYEGFVFKRALFLQAGVDLRYHSSYFTPNFDPVISQFLVQRSQQVLTLPVVDAFINFRVKKARVFLSLTDATEGLLSPGGYFVIPGYPSSGRTFRFGVSWEFFD